MVALAALSTRPDVEVYFTYLWGAGMLVFSVVVLWRWWQDPQDPRDVGFGIARLPLPRSWKRWIYDERK
jgi:hypothetical protein